MVIMRPLYIPTNREKRLTPQKGQYWCYYCDRALVSNGAKCPLCKKRNGIKRLKKLPPE